MAIDSLKGHDGRDDVGGFFRYKLTAVPNITPLRAQEFSFAQTRLCKLLFTLSAKTLPSVRV
jgi:hypothetical protein